MKRRNLLRKAAVGSLMVAGVGTAAASSRVELDQYYVLVQDESGQRVIKGRADPSDVDLQSHCHEDCCDDCDWSKCDECVCGNDCEQTRK